MADGVDVAGADDSGAGPGAGATAGDVLPAGGSPEEAAGRNVALDAADSGPAAGNEDAKAAGEPASGPLDSDEWSTPPELYEELNRRFGPFDFDLFACQENTKCARFLKKDDDAFSTYHQRWDELGCSHAFGNPPYSRGKVPLGNQGRAVQLARETVERAPWMSVCLLVQSTTDKAWFHEVLMAGADLAAKETIPRGPLEGVRLLLQASRCWIDCYFLKGRVSFVNPATGEIAGTGTQGSLVLNFTARRPR